MRFLKIILSIFALFYRLTPNYLIISDVYFLHREIDRQRKKARLIYVKLHPKRYNLLRLVVFIFEMM